MTINKKQKKRPVNRLCGIILQFAFYNLHFHRYLTKLNSNRLQHFTYALSLFDVTFVVYTNITINSYFTTAIILAYYPFV